MTTERFWGWFTTEADRLRQIPAADAASEVNARLQKLNPMLCVEIGDNSTRGEMVISASGVASEFSEVRRIALAAPSLKEWSITALKPAKGFRFTLTAGNASLFADSLKFIPLTGNTRGVAVRIAFPNLMVDAKERRRLLLVALLTGIGEELYARIDQLQIANANAASSGDWIPIKNLAEYIERHQAARSLRGSELT